jgi:putative ABC transport system permease protein
MSFPESMDLPSRYLVGLAPGITADQYIDSVADGGNAGLIAAHPESQMDMLPLRIVIGTLTVLLMLVAGLGVAHTVVLNTRERRRDLAIVKAVGMTPGQVVVMAVTSMAALGLIGGILALPGGVAAQQRVIRLIGDSQDTGLPQTIVDVYAVPSLAVLFLAGVVIAVLGALIPARRAARVSTAEALHTE